MMPPDRERSRSQRGPTRASHLGDAARASGAVKPSRASHLGPRDSTPRPSSAPGMAAMKKLEGEHARRADTQESEAVVQQEEEWATLEELGERWHMNGCRVWNWAHQGYYCNGFIGFLAGGRLCTSFADKKGTWKRVDEDTMIVTFGSCIHKLVLSAKAAASKRPFFAVTGRSRRDGQPLTNPNDPGTYGYPRGLSERKQS